MRIALVLLLVTVVRMPAVRADEACDRRVRAMARQLDALPDRPPAVEIAIDALPSGDLRHPIEETGAVLVVQHDFALVLDGENLGEDDAVAAKIIGERAGQAGRLYVAAAPTERWTRLQNALAGVPARTERRLVVSRSAPSSSREIETLVQALYKAAGSCSDVLDAFSRGGSHPQSHQWHYLKRDITEGVTACKCSGVDVERLTGVVSKLGRSQGSYGWLAWPAPSLKLAPSATVADVAARLR